VEDKDKEEQTDEPAACFLVECSVPSSDEDGGSEASEDTTTAARRSDERSGGSSAPERTAAEAVRRNSSSEVTRDASSKLEVAVGEEKKPPLTAVMVPTATPLSSAWKSVSPFQFPN
jgi:hypothetical protein